MLPEFDLHISVACFSVKIFKEVLSSIENWGVRRTTAPSPGSRAALKKQSSHVNEDF